MTNHSFSSPIAIRKPIENTNKIIASSGVIIFNIYYYLFVFESNSPPDRSLSF